jgi:hypothetical protein
MHLYNRIVKSLKGGIINISILLQKSVIGSLRRISCRHNKWYVTTIESYFLKNRFFAVPPQNVIQKEYHQCPVNREAVKE